MQIDIVRFDTVAIHGRFSHCTTKIYPKNCAADIDRSHSPPPPPPHTHTLSLISLGSRHLSQLYLWYLLYLQDFGKGVGGGGVRVTVKY